ncbi:hyperosmotically inducible protein [Paraburkholderia sp. RAU6.4a]|uniref:BON domain-containing protein n=1 Tax=Paraburkholderia sp. RAU6.4a TaxID=2991067 RepID=UPI003D1A7ED3
MKLFHATRCIGGALLALTACGAIAQGNSEAHVAAPAVTASSNAKAVRREDRLLQKKVRQALARTKGISASGISVRARSGVVTLQGGVPDESQIPVATQVAKGVSGVNSVNNQLMVRPAGQ